MTVNLSSKPSTIEMTWLCNEFVYVRLIIVLIGIHTDEKQGPNKVLYTPNLWPWGVNTWLLLLT